MSNYQQIGTQFTEQFQNNYFLNEMFDSWTWIVLKLMYAPYELPTQLGDAQSWAKNMGLDGTRWFDMCNPK